MRFLAESPTGKGAYYDEWGNRYLFGSAREHRHYLILRTIEWLLGYCREPREA